MTRRSIGAYPADWPEIAERVKAEAGALPCLSVR